MSTRSQMLTPQEAAELDTVEHPDCGGQMYFDHVLDVEDEKPREVFQCDRCGPVVFEIDGPEISRGEPPAGTPRS